MSSSCLLAPIVSEKSADFWRGFLGHREPFALVFSRLSLAFDGSAVMCLWVWISECILLEFIELLECAK